VDISSDSLIPLIYGGCSVVCDIRIAAENERNVNRIHQTVPVEVAELRFGLRSLDLSRELTDVRG
jgi:hypothetical protein